MSRLLTFRRARTYAAVLVVLYAAAYSYALATGSPPLNGAGQPIGGDYIAFHAAGRLLLTGRATELYDHAAVAEVQASLLGGRLPGLYDAFRNPPFAALPFVPLAAVDLLPGFVIWSVLSASCLGLSLWLLIKEVPCLETRWRGLVILVIAFAPVYFGLIDGENATVSLLLYVLIYRALARNQYGRAGMWAAVGLFKPQLFFVFPLVLLARRSWRGLLACGLVALGLVAVSLAMVGAEGLQAWLRILVEPEAGNATANGWRMASLKSLFDALLPNRGALALGLYGATALLLLSGVVALWSKARNEPPGQLLWVFTSLTAVLVDPHLVDYDLSVLVPAGVFLAAAARGTAWLILALYLVVLLRIALPLAVNSQVQLTPLMLCVLAGATWRLVVPSRWFPSRRLVPASSPG